MAVKFRGQTIIQHLTLPAYSATGNPVLGTLVLPYIPAASGTPGTVTLGTATTNGQIVAGLAGGSPCISVTISGTVFRMQWAASGAGTVFSIANPS